MDTQTPQNKSSFGDYVRNIFWILLLLSFAPTLFEGIRRPLMRMFETRTQVAVVPINGVVYEAGIITRQLYTFFKNPAIKAIVIRMDCAGSAAGTGESICHEILSLKKEFPDKRIITVVENICASGGYYIASATDYIIAPGCALIGSIGANMPYLFNVREFIEQYKVHYTPMTAGKYKNAGNPFVDLTPENKALLQGVLDDNYAQFVADIAQNRKLTNADSSVWADGKIFSGRQAFDLGLIDKVGSSYDAIAYLKEKALIEGEIEWVKPAQKSGLAWLFGSQGADDDSSSMFSSMADAICSRLENRYLTMR